MRPDGSEAAPAGVIPEWVPGVYDIDALVSLNGRTWKSLMDGNGYEPGVVGTWRDQSNPPLWVAPAGAVGTWAAGVQAEHNDHLWLNTVDGNAWEPGVYGWEDLGPA